MNNSTPLTAHEQRSIGIAIRNSSAMDIELWSIKNQDYRKKRRERDREIKREEERRAEKSKKERNGMRERQTIK